MVTDWSEKVCCIKGCDLPVLAVGMCNKHWRRNKKYGSPVLLSNRSGSFRGMPADRRFAIQVDKSGDCWIWAAGKDKDGYGIFRGEAGGQMHTRAHRWAFSDAKGGPIPSGFLVCHSCDNPSCVNPAHLSLGSGKENQRQKWARGRANIKRGQHLPAAKLTEQQVRDIRAATGKQSDLAVRFGITQTTVSDIRRRRSWSWLE